MMDWTFTATFLPLWICIAATGISSPTWYDGEPIWPQQSYYDEDGPPIRLDCKVKVTEGLKIMWFKDAELILGNSNLWSRSNHNQTLTLNMPTRSQTGNYQCIISNKAGNISHTGYILIAERSETTRPRIIQTSPENGAKSANIGENITLWCKFDVGGSQTGLLDLTMVWEKNGSILNDTEHTAWDASPSVDNNQMFYLNISNITDSDYGEYKCVGSNSAGNDTRVLALLAPHIASDADHTWIYVLCSVGGVFVIGAVVMATMLYRRFVARSKYEQFDWPEADIEHYDIPSVDLQYDVFVSYSGNDQDWVLNTLFKTMTSQGYEVCIDFKDFTPGMAISENILDAIYKSRKVIVVLSQNFMKSMWGQFELSQALNRAVIQRNDVLILIKYDSCKVPGKLLGKTFLDWTNDDVQPHFWNRLVEAVGEPGHYKNPWNQSSKIQDGGHSEKQNGGDCEKQNGIQSEKQNDRQGEKQSGGESKKHNGRQNGDQQTKKRENESENMKKDNVKTERKSSNSTCLERSVSYTKDDSENVETNVTFVEPDNDGNVTNVDSDMAGLLENENDIIDIHGTVIKI